MPSAITFTIIYYLSLTISPRYGLELFRLCGVNVHGTLRSLIPADKWRMKDERHFYDMFLHWK